MIDEPFSTDDVRSDEAPRPATNLFSRSGSTGNNGHAENGHNGSGTGIDDAEVGRSPFGIPADAHESQQWSADDPWQPVDEARGSDPRPQAAPFGVSETAPTSQSTTVGQPFSSGAGQPVARPDSGQNTGDYVPDQYGLSAAVARLRPDDQERAAVPISVCGALLRHGEVVLGAVTGQMLGHVAVVVVTTERVLVVNGRRWQPIVDIFDVGPGLSVRGRHDRDVAALTFSDDDRLATVDGITEVTMAVDLAERVRRTD